MAGDVVVTTTLGALEKKFEHADAILRGQLHKFWTSAANYMQKRTLKNFQREVTPTGVPWKPLSKLTIDARRKGRKGSKRGAGILKDKGVLMKNATSEAERKKEGPTVLKISAKGVVARVQQEGARIRMTGAQAYWMALHLFVGVKGNKRATKEQQSQAFPIYKNLVGRYFTIPARKFLGFGPNDAIMLAGIWARWFGKAWGEGGH